MTDIEQPGYSRRYLRFVKAHLVEFQTIYLAPSPASTIALTERLRREYVTLPPRHDCSCRCPSESKGWPPCSECKRLRAASIRQDIATEVQHGKPLQHGTVPLVVILDLLAGYT